jgi:Flp pilus assembly protein protease CpaA
VLLPLAILSVPIVISDIHYRKIPNIYLLVLSYCLIPTILIHGLGELTPLILFIVAIFGMSLLGMGMGDFKLLSLIVLFLNAQGQPSLIYFSALVLTFSLAHIFWISIKSGSMPNSIPMAPSIFLALSLYLASR